MNKKEMTNNDFYIVLGYDLWLENTTYTVMYKDHRCVSFKSFDKAHEFLIMCVTGVAKILDIMEGESHEEN